MKSWTKRVATSSVAAALALAMASAPGCSLIVRYSDEPGDPETCDDGNDAVPRDLRMIIDNMDPHIGNLTEVSVINPNDYVVALYADKNNNGSYDPPDTDHSWRIEQTGGPDGLVLQFTHNTSFTDITEELGL